MVGDVYILYQNEAQYHITTGNRDRFVYTMQKGAYYIMVMNMTVMVRPWDVEDAMELHSLSMHPYYLKKRVWKFLYPDTFLNAVSTIHFYQHADPQRYLFRAVELDGSVCGFLECEKKTSSSAELSYWLGVHYWHKGIMQQAVRALCEEAFDTLQVLSIYALVEKRNTASMHVLEANGFQREEFGKLYMFKKYK